MPEKPDPSIKARVDGYIETIKRFEPEIHQTDASAYGTSIAISLKRIADSLEENQKQLEKLLTRLNPNHSQPRY